jgi:hypothetical protein
MDFSNLVNVPVRIKSIGAKSPIFRASDTPMRPLAEKACSLSTASNRVRSKMRMGELGETIEEEICSVR